MYWGYVSAKLVLVLFLQWDRRVTNYSLALALWTLGPCFYFHLKYNLTVAIKIRFKSALQSNGEHFIS